MKEEENKKRRKGKNCNYFCKISSVKLNLKLDDNDSESKANNLLEIDGILPVSFEDCRMEPEKSFLDI